jgi:xanthine dehydrogenase D subunit
MSTARTAERTRDGVGDNARRVDGVPKVAGAFQYGSDLWHEDMLWGFTLRSPHPFARIRSIDTSEAWSSAGVHAVLTAEDLPGKKTYGLEFSDQPVFAWDTVRFVGEPVAAVAAETLELARRAVDAIVVDYEVLPAVTDMERALDVDAPRIHEAGNVVRHLQIVHGDPDAEADVWVEGYYETAMQDQAALGPEAGLAVPAEDGGVELYVSTQWLHVDRAQIAPCLGLPEERVRLYLAGVGGAFGSREDLSVQIHACLLAMRTRRAVKMSYGREESFSGHVHRHPSRIWARTGATRDGRLANVRVRLLMDGGAFTSTSPQVIHNAATFAAGPYEIPNALIEATAVYTNNPPCGAMRGFGAPQVCFAYEAQMDKLAVALGMDPVELRVLNALSRGSMLPTGQVIRGSAPARKVIRDCLSRSLPEAEPPDRRGRLLSLPGGANNVGRGHGVKRGVGFALSYRNAAFAAGFDDSAEARVRLSAGPSGPVAEVQTAAVECGQGLLTVLTQIVHTELGVETVVMLPADTSAGDAGSSSASRQTFMSGGAVRSACAAVRDALFERVRSARARPDPPDPAPLSVDAGRILAAGTPVGPVVDYLDTPIEETRVFHHLPTTRLDDRGQGEPHVMFTFAAARATVDIDEALGLVRVVELSVAQDVGMAINPQGVQGQVEGGAAQGLGLALMEEVQVEDGRIRNASFTDYLIPTILDMPPVTTVLIEEPEPGMPYGAKGAGEPSTVVAPAAIVAALRNATGRELNRIPVRPDDLVGLRPPAASHGPPPSPSVPGPLAILAYSDP